ncbi:signal peptidase II [Kitasatospora aureofaciens]|uniref:Lipoprotein signal peptidase n=1 Tax=Kitasatospora aureofaciens TaxID=1894 RepID=A0A1E7N9G7_KITAU|nr:signal peptidase II [Kitasatospora aureofaciens]OEV37337.1 signal peptidase II [Kitasatospora aureofaciens]UKZ03037.1 signal peptidase II [Streptomyces viridifaciens]GGV00701.1 lipoprotein signal peptidase [Kitasatospora aureofaciens]
MERIITTHNASQSQPETVTRAVGKRTLALTALVTAAVLTYALDLGSKLVAVSRLEGQEPVAITGHVLTLQVFRNSGAAFSSGQAFTVVFTAIAVAVVVVVARAARRLQSLPWAVALGLLLGGALGNLTDRTFREPAVFRGHVVDFISVEHFAVFNLADSGIVCGGALMVLMTIRGTSLDGSAPQDRQSRSILFPR